MKAPGAVTFKQVSTLGMTTGGEKRHPIVIHDGLLKDWVGIGWVTLRTATVADARKYPKVK
jgi:hypothetical protein